MFHARRGWWIALAVILLALPLSAAAEEPAAKAADDSAKTDAKPDSKAEEKPTPPDPFVVPEGTPEELLNYIDRLKELRPEGAEMEQVKAFRRKQFGAMAAAAEKILAGQPEDAQVEAAVRWKVMALMASEQLGDAEAGKALAAFPAQLKKAGREKFARRVEGVLLQRQLREAMKDNGAGLKEVLPQIAAYMKVSEPEMADAQLALITAHMLEATNQRELAAEAYRDLGKILAAAGDPKVAKVGAKFEGAVRRMELQGKPLALEGTYLDGQPLDWADYRGRVVLVQFWATWCGPCRAELKEILKSYELYHDKGFDVLGINCDDNRQAVEDFLKDQPLPWKQLFSADPEAAGMDHPMATYYGVMGIPELILVDREGKVAALGVRGPRLREELEKLLGPAEKKAEEKKTDDKKAEEKPAEKK